MLSQRNSPTISGKKSMSLAGFHHWVDIVFKTVLAVVTILVGYFFSFQKQQNEDIKLIVELFTAPEKEKKVMANSIAITYLEQKRIPANVYVAMVNFANSTEDRGLQAVVNAGANEASKQQPKLKEAIGKSLDALPIRVYLHIRSEADRQGARRVSELLESSTLDAGTIVVPGIENVPGIQMKSSLRCFRKIECKTVGVKLLEILKNNGVTLELNDLSPRYEQSTSIRPNHFEIWFAPGNIK